MTILLLAAGNMLAYKVLRCAAEAGGPVIILGDQRLARLASSRFCRLFVRWPQAVHRSQADALAREINRLVADFGISMVVPADYESTYILATVREQLQTRVFPLPPVSVLETLNDKWTFHQLCQSLRLPAPASRLVSDRSELARVVKSSPSSLTRIAKPIDREGGDGFVKFTPATIEATLPKIDYQPILIQDFVAGRDICISLFCRHGEVLASVVYTPGEHSIIFTQHEQFERCARLIAAHLQYSGVLCFDGRLAPDGCVSFIECNPRFWNHVDSAMICGVNFVALGMTDDSSRSCGAAIKGDTSLRYATRLLPLLIQPWRFSKPERRYLAYRLRDYRFTLGLGNSR